MKSLSNFIVPATLALVIICLVLVDCRPITSQSQVKRAETNVPLLSIANEQQLMIVEQPPQQQQVQYVTSEVQPIEYQQVEVPQQQAVEGQGEQQQQQQPRQEVYYVRASEQPQTSGEPSCNQEAEYTSTLGQEQQRASAEAATETKREYPGEILYINVNGQNRAQEQGAQQQQAVEYSTGEASQISGLPATILTEVPAKDMPHDVLERLKNYYGVRVVATRERPGANLVINCDEYSNQENPVCAKSSSSNLNIPYNFAASSDITDGGHSLSEYSNEQPQSPSELSNEGDHSARAVEENNEARQGMYVTRDGETRVAGGESMAEQETPHDVFGSRNQIVSIENLDQPQVENNADENNNREQAYPEATPENQAANAQPEQVNQNAPTSNGNASEQGATEYSAQQQ